MLMREGLGIGSLQIGTYIELRVASLTGFAETPRRRKIKDRPDIEHNGAKEERSQVGKMARIDERVSRWLGIRNLVLAGTISCYTTPRVMRNRAVPRSYDNTTCQARYAEHLRSIRISVCWHASMYVWCQYSPSTDMLSASVMTSSRQVPFFEPMSID